MGSICAPVWVKIRGFIVSSDYYPYKGGGTDTLSYLQMPPHKE
jgi:hypothetical protein